jgi:hypothetical protein
MENDKTGTKIELNQNEDLVGVGNEPGRENFERYFKSRATLPRCGIKTHANWPSATPIQDQYKNLNVCPQGTHAFFN